MGSGFGNPATQPTAQHPAKKSGKAMDTLPFLTQACNVIPVALGWVRGEKREIREYEILALYPLP